VYLSVVAPNGQVTSLSLADMPLWRLGLSVERRSVALALSYPNMSHTGLGRVTVAAVDCDMDGTELQPIVDRGLPSADRNVNKGTLREEVQKFVNVKPQNVVNELSDRLMRLVDTYHDILQKAWGTDASLQTVVGATTGELGGYRWALLKTRFEPWLSDVGVPVAAAPAFGSVPVGTSAPITTLGGAPAGGTAFPPAPAKQATPAGGSNELDPPGEPPPPPPGPPIPPAPSGKRAKKGGP